MSVSVRRRRHRHGAATISPGRRRRRRHGCVARSSVSASPILGRLATIGQPRSNSTGDVHHALSPYSNRVYRFPSGHATVASLMIAVAASWYIGDFCFGGEGGIRTHGTGEGTTVFETVTIDHSVTSPAGAAGGVIDRDGPPRNPSGPNENTRPIRRTWPSQHHLGNASIALQSTAGTAPTHWITSTSAPINLAGPCPDTPARILARTRSPAPSPCCT